MTDEELDKARAEEAARMHHFFDSDESVATIAARLAREGWQPTPVGDPLVLEAREINAAIDDADGCPSTAKRFHTGEYDKMRSMRVVLAALKRGMEIAREDKSDILEAEIGQLRETLAATYIRLSGKAAHASDCATSSAPAREPGECNCDVQDKREIEAAERRGIERVDQWMVASGLFTDLLMDQMRQDLLGEPK